jgi:hypothetical protein
MLLPALVVAESITGRMELGRESFALIVDIVCIIRKKIIVLFVLIVWLGRENLKT